jgi:hypothetical protein
MHENQLAALAVFVHCTREVYVGSFQRAAAVCSQEQPRNNACLHCIRTAYMYFLAALPTVIAEPALSIHSANNIGGKCTESRLPRRVTWWWDLVVGAAHIN